MQHFYDGQIRRYLTQTIRALSNFVVKYGDGTLVRVPVMYGDADRQVASIMRGNSENTINSTPRMAVYVSSFALDRSRLGDATHVGKLHIREREILNGEYTGAQGKNYTVERLMPTPFKLTMKCDIWAANTDQKLQLLEQILVLFNPSLELQTSDNYIDWTSLTVLDLNDVTWSSRSVPVGAETPIDIATLTFETPVWLSPPVKVKHLGVVTNIITSVFQTSDQSWTGVDGLGYDSSNGGTTTMSGVLTRERVTIGDFGLLVHGGSAVIMNAGENAVASGNSVGLEIPIRQGTPRNWDELFAQYPGQYFAGSSQIFLVQSNGTEVMGRITINALDNTLLSVNWDEATYPVNNGIDSNGYIEYLDYDPNAVPLYDGPSSYRWPTDPGTFDAIINPQTITPTDAKLPTLVAGIRYLLVEDIGDAGNADGADAWKSTLGVDFIAKANDIIEWDGAQWHVIFEAAQKDSVIVYQTNKYTEVQYKWNGVSWVKSFEGEYKAGTWRLEL